MKSLTDGFILSNSVKMPCIGLGTYLTPDGQTAVDSVKCAIRLGYRHIDAAACYNNEVSVGQGIAEGLAECGLSRQDIFVTSKVWNTERGYSKTWVAFQKTLEDLKLDYLDLYLIHWPASSHQFENWEALNLETWEALTDLYIAGRIKAIGVSNFLPYHIEALMKTKVQPMVNQIEYHPGFRQIETVNYCRQNMIQVEAWSPLGRGRLFEHPLLIRLAEKYQKSIAQICIKWCLQNDVAPLPKSITPTRLAENADVFDFTLDSEDMAAIDAIEDYGASGLHPDEISF